MTISTFQTSVPQQRGGVTSGQPAPEPPPKMLVERFSASYDENQVLRNVTLDIRPNERLAIIGPDASGKSTLCRSLNRLTDLDPNFSKVGRILLDGKDIYSNRMS